MQKLIKGHGLQPKNSGVELEHRVPQPSSQQQLNFKQAEELAQNNTSDFQPTCRFFPANHAIAQQCSFPLGFFFSPFPDVTLGKRFRMLLDRLTSGRTSSRVARSARRT